MLPKEEMTCIEKKIFEELIRKLELNWQNLYYNLLIFCVELKLKNIRKKKNGDTIKKDIEQILELCLANENQKIILIEVFQTFF